MLPPQLIKYLPHLVLLVIIAVLVIFGVNRIKSHAFDEGAASVQAEWDKQTREYENEIDRLRGEIATKEADHRTENTRITHELAEANRKHDVEVATLQSDFARRLQLSSQRSTVYQSQAEGGAAECRSLASHAGRLDASLEEGRSLVRELRTTLGLRDQQIQSLSDQIRNDRKLMED